MTRKQLRRHFQQKLERDYGIPRASVQVSRDGAVSIRRVDAITRRMVAPWDDEVGVAVAAEILAGDYAEEPCSMYFPAPDVLAAMDRLCDRLTAEARRLMKA